MAAITVGDVQVIVRARLDEFRAELSKGAETEGAKAGDKAGAAFDKAIKKFGAAAITGLFAVATKGAVELDTATRSAAASMGLAESEVGALSGRLLDLFKTNPTKSFKEIGDTIAALKTDLGLTVEEAGNAAQAFLNFSQVTGQTGVSAVKALDDILDAFNLEASDSERVMDLLVASHQKYGGSITDNQNALKALAPALSAMNLTVDDGAALLNLFATTGLDASKATFALNTAVKNLKPGQNLNTLIKQLAAIEDPTKRAQESIKIFGARGGVGLANALKPGITGLDDFKVSTEDAAGATSAAAATINNSFQNQITTAFRTFIGGPLASLGPAVTSVLGTLAGLTTALIGMGVTFDVLKAKVFATFDAINAKALTLVGVLGLLTYALTNKEGEEARELIHRLADEYQVASGQATGFTDAAIALTGAIKASDADLGQFVASVDGVGIAVGSAATRVDEATGLMADDMVGLAADAKGANYRTSFSIKGIGGAATASKEELDAAMEAMLQKLIDSRDPVKQAAEAYGKAIKDPIDISDRIELLEQMIVAVAPDLESEAPNVRAAAQLYINAARDEITLLTSQMYGYGTGAASAWLRGFAGQIHRQVGDVNVALDEIRSLTQGQSPPEKGPLKDIDKWGRAIGETFVTNLAGGISNSRAIVQALSALPFGGLPTAQAAPSFTAATPTSAGRGASSSVGGIGGTTINVGPIINPAREPASQSVDERLRILAATGII